MDRVDKPTLMLKVKYFLSNPILDEKGLSWNLLIVIMLPTFYLFSGDDGMDPRLVPAVPAARYTPPITLLSLFKDKYYTTMYM